MSGVLVDALLVLFFIVVGGVFAGSEIALVSLRESQIDGLRRRGGRGATVAKLAEDPNRFLSAVQVGVTVTGFFSASFGAATIAPVLAPRLEQLGLSAGAAGTVAFVGITLVVAGLSLVLGELAPKRLALQRAEGLSLLVARPLDLVARLLRPVIWFLGKATDVVVRMLGGDPAASREEMGEEELRSLVREHEALDPVERRIVSEALELADKSVRDVLVPRTEVAVLPATLTVEQALDEAVGRPHSRYPVVGENVDDVLGFVHVRDLYGTVRAGGGGRGLDEIVRRVPVLPESLPVLGAMSTMRRAHVHLAVVVDEYGGNAGIVTLEDLVEEVLGDIRDEYDPPDDAGPRLPEGVVEVDGLLHVDDVGEHVDGLELPGEGFETVGGFVLDRLGRVPEVGDTVDAGTHELRVVEMDGRRVSRVRALPVAADPDEPDSPDDPDAAGTDERHD
ncbi:hemolysin family protein [Aquipuribacter nitratireducens]|uniref:Hemolysin family protein n=1 Tax=Aquipuribacter nitratireducens TaxID=650104 RepID=A0ABW0GN15_9MICO